MFEHRKCERAPLSGGEKGERKHSGWQLGMAFINQTLPSSMVWPRVTTPLERQSRGNNSWTLWVLTHMLSLPRPPRVSYFPHQQLSSCTDVRALSQFMLTLLTICFSLSASSWVRVWERSLRDPSPCTPWSFCDSTSRSRRCEPDDEQQWEKKTKKTNFIWFSSLAV